MASSITVNAATLNRPGVFVTQSATGGLPQPLASHAVGYLFGTTPADEYYGGESEGIYSNFLPYTPTQVASPEDYLQRIGGSTPSGSVGALTTYDAVKGFFDNVGVNGILYFTRVTPTPETLINLSGSVAGSGYNAFALKVNGRYFGTPINVIDLDGDEIKVITTTAIDAFDNARDLYNFLSSNDSDGFSDFYKVEQTATEATQGKFRIFARDNSLLPKIDLFVAYNFSDTGYASPQDINTASVVRLFTSVKDINFRCNSREIATGETVLYVDGSAVSLFIAAANAVTPGTYVPATGQSGILRAYLASKGVTAIANNKVVAVSQDFTSGVAVGNKWPDADAAYWRYTLGTTTFAKIGGATPTVPTGTVSADGMTRTGFLPDSVQVFYVSVAGENRAIIVNGAKPDDLANGLRDEIIAILAEKNLAQYYTVETVPTGSNYSGTNYAPNNGYAVSDLVSAAGAPFIRPDINYIALTGTVAITTGGVVTGTSTLVSPVFPGVNRQGLLDDNVAKLTSITEGVGYEGYKLTSTAKAQDFVYGIEKGMSGDYYAPGFLLAPEAYATLSYSADSDLASRSEAANERLKITQTLVSAAEGRFGVTEGVSGTQHMAIIDCGGDIENVAQAQDELNLIKQVVGVPYGHAAYFAPYVKNLSDRFVPPSSFVTGIACSRFVNEGFQQPPAGSRYPLRGVVGLKFNITAQQQEVTYALGLNPIRSLPNRGIVVHGSRTLSSSPLFRFVNTRVILNVLIDVMNRSFDDILFESIDSGNTIFSRVKSIATQVLNQFYRQGALFGNRPEQAYLVVCGAANNSSALLEQGTVRMDAYVATSPTLERLAITIVRTPVGQVSLLSDSFSRNEERFTSFLDATNLSV